MARLVGGMKRLTLLWFTLLLSSTSRALDTSKLLCYCTETALKTGGIGLKLHCNSAGFVLYFKCKFQLELFEFAPELH